MERHRVTEPKNKISFLAVLNSKRLAASSWKHHLGYDKYTDKKTSQKPREGGLNLYSVCIQTDTETTRQCQETPEQRKGYRTELCTKFL